MPPAMTQKARTIVMLAVVALALVSVFLWNRRELRYEATSEPVASGSAAAAGSSTTTTTTTASDKLRRIDKPTRAALLERMRSARVRGSSSPTPPPALPALPPLPGKLAATDVRKAVRELVPLLAECYDAALPRLTKQDGGITISLLFTGEPEVGTLIQSAEITGDDNLTQDAELVECFQQTLLSIELPPMTERGEVTVTYPIKFSP